MVLKTIITPLQSWLLKGGRCVGCGESLSKGKRKASGDKEKVVCKCGRIYIFDKKTKKYRRATFEEGQK